MTPSFRVSGQEAGERLDVVLARRAGLARSRVQRLLAAGLVHIDGQVRPKHFELHAGEHVTWQRPPPAAAAVNPEPLEVPVLYEDRWLLVVDKPAGMVVHPAPGHEHGTLVNALATRGLAGGHDLRPGVVHRLDKDTSGLIIVAKNDAAHHSLQAQIQKRTASRKYLALVWGDTKFEKAVVDAPIGRHPVDRKKMAVVTQGGRARPAVTDLRVVERLHGFTLLEASLRTGRTHQIRVHCAYISHPVVGDPVYGGKRQLSARFGARDRAEFERLVKSLGGQALHAYYLSFDHPRTGRRMEFEAPVPHDMANIIDWLRVLK